MTPKQRNIKRLVSATQPRGCRQYLQIAVWLAKTGKNTVVSPSSGGARRREDLQVGKIAFSQQRSRAQGTFKAISEYVEVVQSITGLRF